MKPILKTKNKSIQLKEVHDTLRLIQEQDLDFVGKKYLKRANQNILQHNFRAAYKNIFLGFENIVCDCGIGGWLLRDLKKSLLKSKTFNCNIYQLNLIQAYIHWISREYESALNFINSFIHYKNDDEIGFYLKG
ncbi:MAG: hypothetical protein K8R85_14710, partial [Bacteroidetes bacterium]|nr:hypothetical protein [Bacteroidota bacterium]